ncbi:hypothetical protein [Mucilaginibacter gracilis]|nr:hypothetical protein [Mucilaginibacter gracilis]
MTDYTKSVILLSTLGVLWYTNLVMLIVSMTDFPGSYELRDYKLLIGLVLIFMTGCFRQTYVMWKKGRPVNDNE